METRTIQITGAAHRELTLRKIDGRHASLARALEDALAELRRLRAERERLADGQEVGR